MDKPDQLGELRIERDSAATTAGRGRGWIVAALLLAAAVAGWVALGRGSAAREVELVSAVSAGNETGTGSVLDASGYVVARRQATVSSKVTGKVAEVLIEEGMQVRAGQLLARLEATQQQADLELRRAQRAAAQAQLGEIEAQLALAIADRGRQQDLFDRRLGSAAGLDAARAQADALRARLASARSQVEVAERTLALSGVALADTEIRAPFDGIVIAKAAQPGEMISPVSAGGGFTRTGIGTLVDMDSLEVEVDVNEAFIGRVAAGMPVASTLNAYPDWKIPGEVIAVIPAADRTKATVRVRVALHARDARIVPDMGVRVAFMEARSPAPQPTAAVGVWVPASAVITRGGRSAVFVQAGEHAVLREVSTGERRGDRWLLTAGLAAGQRVVVDPPPGLEDGERVAPAGATRN